MNGVRVLRFPVPRPRDVRDVRPHLGARVRAAARPRARPRAGWRRRARVAPELLEHLRSAGADYDAVVFMTYLYATTALGLPLVADRSVLVPDRPRRASAAAADLRRGLRGGARARVQHARGAGARASGGSACREDRCRLIGVGVDEPPPTRPAAVRRRARASSGRTRSTSGGSTPRRASATLVEDHRAYRDASPDGLDLVLVGRGELDAAGGSVAPRHRLRHRAGEARRDRRRGGRRRARRRTSRSRSRCSRRGATGGRRSRTPTRRCWSASRAARAAGSGTATASSTRRCSTCSRGRARSRTRSAARAGATPSRRTAGRACASAGSTCSSDRASADPRQPDGRRSARAAGSTPSARPASPSPPGSTEAPGSRRDGQVVAPGRKHADGDARWVMYEPGGTSNEASVRPREARWTTRRGRAKELTVSTRSTRRASAVRRTGRARRTAASSQRAVEPPSGSLAPKPSPARTTAPELAAGAARTR